MRAKFIPLEKVIKRIYVSRGEIFQKNCGYTLFDLKRSEEMLEEPKVEPADDKLRRFKTNCLQHVTRINCSRMPKIILNYRPNGRRGLGRTLKRLLDEVETGLLGSNW